MSKISGISRIPRIFKNGIVENNPLFVQALGMCPALAVTTSATNGLGMGVATTSVLVCSNIAISLVARFLPANVRIPCYIVIIATFVTMLEFMLEAYMPALNQALGIFIPLIVVNCIVMGRAEAFANKNGAFLSAFDGLAMGLGFTAALTVMGAVREILGTMSIFGITISETFPQTIAMILPPGAFITLAFLMALINYVRGRTA
ncbi:MAG: electron transport complex subunit E [Defluviitaleaceae bacterium]|nr:electron transport complex subunit E [Defluviitaleaceae bacterium]